MASPRSYSPQFSSHYTFVRSRQCQGTYPGDLQKGQWPIYYYRIAKGWGLLPYRYWPTQPSDLTETTIPNEPLNADELAKPYRIWKYHRSYSEQDTLYATATGLDVSASMEITTDWITPIDGVLTLNVDHLPKLGVHCVGIPPQPPQNGFIFPNSWGEEWGYGGFGWLPRGYLDRYAVDQWMYDLQPFTQCNKAPHIYMHRWHIKHASIHGPSYGIEIHDGRSDEMIGWGIAVHCQGQLLVEDLFVRPKYRRHGYGTQIGTEVLDLAQTLKAEPVFWVPWGDHEESNREALLGLSRSIRITFRPSNYRWSPFRGGASLAFAGSLPELPWAPKEAAGPLRSLTIEAINSWTDDKISRRLALIDKKYEDSGLSAAETSELNDLQHELSIYQDIVSPPPEIEQ